MFNPYKQSAKEENKARKKETVDDWWKNVDSDLQRVAEGGCREWAR